MKTRDIRKKVDSLIENRHKSYESLVFVVAVLTFIGGLGAVLNKIDELNRFILAALCILLIPSGYGIASASLETADGKNPGRKKSILAFIENYGKIFSAYFIQFILIILPMIIPVAFAFMDKPRVYVGENFGMATLRYDYPSGAHYQLLVLLLIVCLIACVYMSIRLVFTGFVIKDEGLAGFNAVRRSWTMTAGHFWDVLKFRLSFIGWDIFMVLTSYFLFSMLAVASGSVNAINFGIVFAVLCAVFALLYTAQIYLGYAYMFREIQDEKNNDVEKSDKKAEENIQNEKADSPKESEKMPDQEKANSESPENSQKQIEEPKNINEPEKTENKEKAVNPETSEIGALSESETPDLKSESASEAVNNSMASSESKSMSTSESECTSELHSESQTAEKLQEEVTESVSEAERKDTEESPETEHADMDHLKTSEQPDPFTEFLSNSASQSVAKRVAALNSLTEEDDDTM